VTGLRTEAGRISSDSCERIETTVAAPRSADPGMVLLYYAVFGPPIGAGVSLSLLSLIGFFHSLSTHPFRPVDPFFGTFLVVVISTPLSYIYGLLPAGATGLVAAIASRISSFGARKSLIHGFASGVVGAAASILFNFLMFPLKGLADNEASVGVADNTMAVVVFFIVLPGFAGGFCCHALVVRRVRAALRARSIGVESKAVSAREQSET
jgi:hypothetical protein